MFFDAHVHSQASIDSEMNPREAIAALARKGLGIAFTEHLDFVTPTEGRDWSATDAPDALADYACDLEMYPSTYQCLRSDSVLLGLEIALTAAFLPLNTRMADEGDYDFILGSIHNVKGKNIYFDHKDGMDPISRYFTYAASMVELCGFFDAFAHLDYVARYSAEVAAKFKYENYPKEFDAFLSAMSEKGLALEINTQRFGDIDAEKDLLVIYRRFAALGGKYCTIGSDAHELKRLGRHMDRARKFAGEAGLLPVYYKNRKRYPM